MSSRDILSAVKTALAMRRNGNIAFGMAITRRLMDVVSTGVKKRNCQRIIKMEIKDNMVFRRGEPQKTGLYDAAVVAKIRYYKTHETVDLKFIKPMGWNSEKQEWTIKNEHIPDYIARLNKDERVTFEVCCIWIIGYYISNKEAIMSDEVKHPNITV